MKIKYPIFLALGDWVRPAPNVYADTRAKYHTAVMIRLEGHYAVLHRKLRGKRVWDIRKLVLDRRRYAERMKSGYFDSVERKEFYQYPKDR